MKKYIKASYDAYTENLADFGYRELEEGGKLLLAIKNGLPEDFSDDGIKLAFNRNSGYVFLTNDDYQVAMVDDDGKLYSFYTTPYSGYEGSAEDLFYEADESWDKEDLDYLLEIAEYNDISAEDIAKVQALFDSKME